MIINELLVLKDLKDNYIVSFRECFCLSEQLCLRFNEINTVSFTLIGNLPDEIVIAVPIDFVIDNEEKCIHIKSSNNTTTINTKDKFEPVIGVDIKLENDFQCMIFQKSSKN